MEIVKFKREQEQHLQHIQRIRNSTPMLDTSTPESLGLKHLALRPKKMQLVEDRRQVVAKENAKLMALMTNIMNEKREQPQHLRPPSLNEIERKRQIDRVNFENRLMVERLSRINPVISNKALKESFQKHLKAEENLRRRQMKPLALPKDLHPNSPLRNRLNRSADNPDFNLSTNLSMGLFDSSLYTTQRNQFNSSSNLASIESSPIKNVTDFRKQVISTKKLQKQSSWSEQPHRLEGVDSFQAQSITYSPGSSIHVGESKMSLDTIPRKKNTKTADSLFEVTHVPK